MVKHIILWKLREDMEKTEIPAVKSAAKAALEGLFGKIEGLCEIHLKTEGLPSSNADMMLITVFKDEESLKGYQKSPLHNAAADKYVRPYTAQRLCFDFEE